MLITSKINFRYHKRVFVLFNPDLMQLSTLEVDTYHIFADEYLLVIKIIGSRSK